MTLHSDMLREALAKTNLERGNVFPIDEGASKEKIDAPTDIRIGPPKLLARCPKKMMRRTKRWSERTIE
jgi:hypothetical protein